MSAPSQPPPLKRRWFQYRLRTLLLLVLVVNLGLGWVMKERRRIAQRREALMAAGFVGNVREPQPTWHALLFGDDPIAFSQSFHGNATTNDAVLPHLQGLTQLQKLSLDHTQVSDAGLVHLRELTQLQELGLSHTQVSDTGLVHLQRLTQLQWLALYGTQVSTAGVAKLKKALPNCQFFH